MACAQSSRTSSARERNVMLTFGSTARTALVARADGVPADAIRAVRTDRVLGTDLERLALGGDNPRRDMAVVLLQHHDAPADQESNRWQIRRMLAQHALDDRLRHLLTAFGEFLTPRSGKLEGASETRNLVSERSRAEDDVLRERHRNRRGGAQALRETKPTQVLHRPDARGLRSGPERIRLEAGFDDEDPDASVAELDGGREAARSAADNQHVNIVRRGAHGRSDGPTPGVRIDPRRGRSAEESSMPAITVAARGCRCLRRSPGAA